MAGRPGTRARAEAAEAETDHLRQETARLRGLLARVAPELLEASDAPAKTEYDSTILESINAFAAQGMAESEWIAAFGISIGTWNNWIRNHPELAEATQRASARYFAWWDEQARDAMHSNNTRFPVSVYQAVKANALDTLQSFRSMGDASELVHVAIGIEGRGILSRNSRSGTRSGTSESGKS